MIKYKDLNKPNQLQVKFHYLCSLLVDLVHGSADDSSLQVQRSRNKIVEEVSNSLAHQGYHVDKSRFRFLYQFGLMEKAYPETFRYLSAEESYYYWKSLGN